MSNPKRSSAIAALLREKTLVICVGCGGVGKTTTAAALAVAATLLGRHTAVLTVDPARRLKTALGLDTLSHEPHPVQLHDGHCFDALELDTKRTFDALVERFAPDPQTAERIFANRLYQELSNELAGSAEYMAMERLHELHASGRYDIVILDTPPSAHIQDLLAAPNRLLALLASRAVQLLRAPASLVQSAPSGAARLALRALLHALQRWSGLPLLRDLADFVAGFEHMLEGFARRANHVSALLHDGQTAFVVVTSAEPHTVKLATAFARELQQGQYPVAGVVANRVHVFGTPAALPPTANVDSFTRRLWANYRDLATRSERDSEWLSTLARETGLALLARIPAQASPPNSIAALESLARDLLRHEDTRAPRNRAPRPR